MVSQITVKRANIGTDRPSVRIKDATGERLVYSVKLLGPSWIGFDPEPGMVVVDTDSALEEYGTGQPGSPYKGRS